MNLTKQLAGLLAALAGVAVMNTAVAAPLLSEGFNDIGALPGAGWVLINDSVPPGGSGWFQGRPGFGSFPAAAGPANSYIAANFNNAAFGGSISNWLLTPELALFNGESLHFALRLLGDGLLDRVEVYFSDGGDSVALGDFSLLSAYSSTVDTGWIAHSVIVGGLGAPASGRFAFRYVVDDTSLNGNYIGIDSVSVAPNALPAPGSLGLVMLGGVFLLVARRRPAARWLACAGMSVCAVVAQAAPDGVMTFPHVNVVRAQTPSLPAPPSGFMAYKDPLTGRLGNPTAEQAAALTGSARQVAPIAKPRTALRQIVRPPHGGLSVMLDESFDRYAIARKDADGVVTTSCEPLGEAQ